LLQNAETCYFTRVDGENGAAAVARGGRGADAALSTLAELEATVAARATEEVPPGAKPSWTRRLLQDTPLLCSKVREEAGELCATLEGDEGAERAASEAADLLYHATVLLQAQGVRWADVMAVLRRRQGVSGVAEKAARVPKPQQ
jgi:phosphoribosyl-ATP pyrophosphohydrolase/phosphoribosyl-AMP cyclohydrolase